MTALADQLGRLIRALHGGTPQSTTQKNVTTPHGEKRQRLEGGLIVRGPPCVNGEMRGCGVATSSVFNAPGHGAAMKEPTLAPPLPHGPGLPYRVRHRDRHAIRPPSPRRRDFYRAAGRCDRRYAHIANRFCTQRASAGRSNGRTAVRQSRHDGLHGSPRSNRGQ